MLNICYESTKACNLNCDYCITSDNPKMEKNDKYEDIIKYISCLNPERLVISGGEPLMDPLLCDKLELMSNILNKSYISISTNGTIESFDFRQIINYINCVDFSIPSLDPAIYEQMRGKNYVDIVKNNITELKNLIETNGKQIDIRISFTLTKINKDSLNDLLEYALQENVNSFRIGRFFPFRNARNVADKYLLSDNEINETINSCKNIIEKCKENKIKIIEPIENLSLMENGYITINFMGDIILPNKDGKTKLGNISNTPLEKFSYVIDKQNSIFKDIDVKQKEYIYKKFLSHKRIRDSKLQDERTSQEEFNSDKTRIIYSSSFRRLQQKAQVFSLEKNSNVHSRLTHSLEVADVGRILATKITNKLISINGIYRLNESDASQIITIVENACLIHDLGNPPFGHFGEDAIKTWWIKNKDKYINQYNNNAQRNKTYSIDFNNKDALELQKDFELFDGNPQGFRVISRLHCYNDKDDQELESGLNLTYSTLMSAIKYVGCANNLNPNKLNKSISKKAGYFVSEKPIVDKILQEMMITSGYRFPFTYIMEAADDIAYCMSDISDGFEKGVLTIPQFTKEFIGTWKKKYNEDVPDSVLSQKIIKKLLDNEVRDFNASVTSSWANYIVNDTVDTYVNYISSFIDGTAPEIINDKHMKESCKILNTIREIANKIIYRSPEAEGIEVAGFAIVTGLLDFFGELLKLTKEQFEAFVNISEDTNDIRKAYAFEFRIFNMLSKRCVESYKHQLNEWEIHNDYNVNIETLEWWLRIHLIIDHISGMTDDYALQSYQLSKGIDIKIR